MSPTTVTTTNIPSLIPQKEGQEIVKSSLVHLRLLYAFRRLRLQIGHQDGLWGIHDDRLDDQTPPLTLDERNQGLARIKEKRWAIYLARAVHRYDAWWKAMNPKPLTEAETESTESARYAKFPQKSVPLDFTEENMMPLGEIRLWTHGKHFAD